jgi:hypothetical protein
MQTKFLLPLLMVLGACAGTRPFEPTSNVKEELGSGPSAAHYDVRTGPGDFGTVSVDLRTDGVQGEAVKGSTDTQRLVVHMNVNNNSSKAVALDTSRLELKLIVDEKKQGNGIPVVSPPTDTEIAGHSKKDFVLAFPVPSGTKSKQISAFELSWGLTLGTEKYSQATGFSRDANYTNRDVYYVYDPFFYPSASFGYGYYGSPHRTRSGVNLGIGFGIGN